MSEHGSSHSSTAPKEPCQNDGGGSGTTDSALISPSPSKTSKPLLILLTGRAQTKMDKYREHLASTELVNKTFSRYGATLSADPPPNFGDEVRTILLCSNNPNHHFVTDTDLGAVEEAKKWRASMHESLLADAEVWRTPKIVEIGQTGPQPAGPTSWGSIFVLNDAREPLSLRMECLLELVARRGTDQPISVLYDDLTGFEQALAEWRIDDKRAARQNAEKGVLGGSEPTAMDLTAPPTSNSASHEDPACL